jgi:hypothetical protein
VCALIEAAWFSVQSLAELLSKKHHREEQPVEGDQRCDRYRQKESVGLHRSMKVRLPAPAQPSDGGVSELHAQQLLRVAKRLHGRRVLA